MRRLVAFLLLPLAAFVAQASHADTVKVLTAGAFKQVVVAMVPAFEARTGHKVEVSNDTAGELAKRIAGGESFDVVAMPPGALRPLVGSGRVVADSVVPLAKVGIGVAVVSGAPAPLVGTVEEFRQTLLAAGRVAFIDPASGGSSGVYLVGLFERLGIADAMKAKAVLVPGGLVAQRLVDGEADLAIHQISEILPVAGATLVGPLPDAVQNYTTYAAGLAADATHREAAAAFVVALKGSATAAALRDKGMTPAD